MYSLIESGPEIARAQKKLFATIRKEFPLRIQRNIGWQSGRIEGANLFASEKYWCWIGAHMEGAIARNHNWFGVYGDGPGVSITVEINTAHEATGRIAGFFARHNRTGRIYLFHSGGVAGGEIGVGKDNFLAWAGLTPDEVWNASGGLRFGIPVMPVEGIACTRSAINYVQRIVDFKRAVREGSASNPDILEDVKRLEGYYKEAVGRRTGKRRNLEIDYETRHGEVVQALYDWRKALGLAGGLVVTNRGLMDLGVRRAGKLVEVYEVKSSVGRQAVYTAIGQVTVHASDGRCRRILVLPKDEPLQLDLEQALHRNGIELLRYGLTEIAAFIV